MGRWTDQEPTTHRRSGGGSATVPPPYHQVSARLARKPPDEIVQFEVILDGLLDDSYHWDLWGAAYLINGGCSDDCFDYFRGWLMVQGRTVWDAALADPDSLATVVGSGGTTAECEDVLYAPMTAYVLATGKSDDFFWDVVNAREAASSTADEPAGAQFDFEDGALMAHHFPRLSALDLS